MHLAFHHGLDLVEMQTFLADLFQVESIIHPKSATVASNTAEVSKDHSFIFLPILETILVMNSASLSELQGMTICSMFNKALSNRKSDDQWSMIRMGAFMWFNDMLRGIIHCHCNEHKINGRFL